LNLYTVGVHFFEPLWTWIMYGMYNTSPNTMSM